MPYVFTEQGIAMLSGLLKNKIAVKVSINIIKVMKKIDNYQLIVYNNIYKGDELFWQMDTYYLREQYKHL